MLSPGNSTLGFGFCYSTAMLCTFWRSRYGNFLFDELLDVPSRRIVIELFRSGWAIFDVSGYVFRQPPFFFHKWIPLQCRRGFSGSLIDLACCCFLTANMILFASRSRSKVDNCPFSCNNNNNSNNNSFIVH